MPQSTNHILMIRPVKFGFNPETAEDNAFQKLQNFMSSTEIHEKALKEFDNFVTNLKSVGITVHVVNDTLTPHTPDSIFPNNWISFHQKDSTLCLFPMATKSRRHERKDHVIKYIENKFNIKTQVDLTRHEKYGQYLEGTGSMILDRENKIAYAAMSERTNEELFKKFCNLMDFQPILFHSVDEEGKPIYHTNVMMCVADKYAVICLDTVRDQVEKEMVTKSLEKSGKVLIRLGYKQVNSFAGNMLQLKGSSRKTILVMSTQAYESLDYEQIAQIEKFDNILHSDLSTIESNGGGSARCMMAEIFLSEKLGAINC